MSREYRGIPARLLMTVAICAGLSVALGAFVILSLTINQCLIRVTTLAPRLDPILVERCERDPAALQGDFGGELEISFYDAETLAAAVPDAPPLDLELVARLRAGEDHPGVRYFLQPWGGAILRRSADEGPCSLVQVRWRVGRGERLATVAMIFGLLAAAMAASIGLAAAVALRPLTSRLRRLREATQQIGREAGYAEVADPTTDDLGQLSHLLDQAHARIAADAARAAERQVLLRNHLADVAHDLRSPLTSMQLSLERLVDPQRPMAREAARAALADVAYMGQLIANLSLASQLEEGADPLHGAPEVDLGAVIERAIQRLAAFARIRGLEVHGSWPDEPVVTAINPGMAEQVIANLIHNAITHAGAGCHVAVTVSTRDDRFELEVADDGPGAPPHELARLGERSFRGERARERAPDGRGLGLAIVAEICRRAGLSLEFTANEPRGLRVRIAGRLR